MSDENLINPTSELPVSCIHKILTFSQGNTLNDLLGLCQGSQMMKSILGKEGKWNFRYNEEKLAFVPDDMDESLNSVYGIDFEVGVQYNPFQKSKGKGFLNDEEIMRLLEDIVSAFDHYVLPMMQSRLIIFSGKVNLMVHYLWMTLSNEKLDQIIRFCQNKLQKNTLYPLFLCMKICIQPATCEDVYLEFTPDTLKIIFLDSNDFSADMVKHLSKTSYPDFKKIEWITCYDNNKWNFSFKITFDENLNHVITISRITEETLYCLMRLGKEFVYRSKQVIVSHNIFDFGVIFSMKESFVHYLELLKEMLEDGLLHFGANDEKNKNNKYNKNNQKKEDKGDKGDKFMVLVRVQNTKHLTLENAIDLQITLAYLTQKTKIDKFILVFSYDASSYAWKNYDAEEMFQTLMDFTERFDEMNCVESVYIYKLFVDYSLLNHIDQLDEMIKN